MFKILKKQDGYMFVLVLGIIVVITLMAIPLINSAISSAKQVNISEEQLQKEKLIDMGKRYARNTIMNELRNLTTTDVAIARSQLDTNIIDESVSFEGEKRDGQFDLKYTVKNNGDEISIHYEITGKLLVKDKNQVIGSPMIAKEKFVIKKGTSGGNGSGNSDSGFNWETDISNAEKLPNSIGNNEEVNKAGNVAIENSIDVNNNATLGVGGHLYANGGNLNLLQGAKITVGKNVSFQNFNANLYQNSSIFVSGNLSFQRYTLNLNENANINVDGKASFQNLNLNVSNNSKILIKDDALFQGVNFAINNNSSICVKGDLYTINNSNWNSFVQTNSCANVENIRGIFYEGNHYTSLNPPQPEEPSSPGWVVIGTFEEEE